MRIVFANDDLVWVPLLHFEDTALLLAGFHVGVLETNGFREYAARFHERADPRWAVAEDGEGGLFCGECWVDDRHFVRVGKRHSPK